MQNNMVMDMALTEVKKEEKPIVPLTPKLERFKKFLTTYTWTNTEGRVILLPILKSYGTAIEWSPRIHKKGVAGAMAFNEPNALMIGMSVDVVRDVETTKAMLEREFKELPTVAKAELVEELKKVLT
jgi:hypothetical protein